jgi:four helix bundle protein
VNENDKRDLKERSYQFALRVIKMVQSLPRTRVALILGDQVLRSGTSIGANVEEAYAGLSKKDFIHSMNIARKEARETKYWTRLIIDSGLLKKERVESLLMENEEIIKILTSIVKTSQQGKKYA